MEHKGRRGEQSAILTLPPPPSSSIVATFFDSWPHYVRSIETSPSASKQP
ncbi:uncharacterized protein G2W53_035028 [Senna tora]|uniref:Uncharacterized protein n=1 Tax=Senna tora TaxID=362788 RepID=A0A834SPI8_9FABA|nr:uncharacterized protein G2W53_035028 [Senna tora]